MNARAAANGPSRILVVEDEPDVRQLLSFNLRRAGYEIREACTLAEALALGEGDAEVAVVDRSLPDGDGIDLCARLRAGGAGSEVGILVLTARGAEADRIEGFEAGADDYVVKPFGIRELLARVRVLVDLVDARRVARNALATGEVLRNRNLTVDLARHRVVGPAGAIELRPIEFRILALLLGEPTHTFTRAELLRIIWGDESAATPRSVDVHIRRLRERLGDQADVVETVHGVGYRARRVAPT